MYIVHVRSPLSMNVAMKLEACTPLKSENHCTGPRAGISAVGLPKYVPATKPLVSPVIRHVSLSLTVLLTMCAPEHVKSADPPSGMSAENPALNGVAAPLLADTVAGNAANANRTQVRTMRRLIWTPPVAGHIAGGNRRHDGRRRAQRARRGCPCQQPPPNDLTGCGPMPRLPPLPRVGARRHCGLVSTRRKPRASNRAVWAAVDSNHVPPRYEGVIRVL